MRRCMKRRAQCELLKMLANNRMRQGKRAGIDPHPFSSRRLSSGRYAVPITFVSTATESHATLSRQARIRPAFALTPPVPGPSVKMIVQGIDDIHGIDLKCTHESNPRRLFFPERRGANPLVGERQREARIQSNGSIKRCHCFLESALFEKHRTDAVMIIFFITIE